MRTPRMLGQELGIDSREIRAAAEALGLGRWVNPRLYLLEDNEVTQLKEALARIIDKRRKRSSKTGRGFATPAPSA